MGKFKRNSKFNLFIITLLSKVLLAMYQLMLHEYHNKVHCLLQIHNHTHSAINTEDFTCSLHSQFFQKMSRNCWRIFKLDNSIRLGRATALTLEKKNKLNIHLNGHKSVRYSVQVISVLIGFSKIFASQSSMNPFSTEGKYLLFLLLFLEHLAYKEKGDKSVLDALSLNTSIASLKEWL